MKQTNGIEMRSGTNDNRIIEKKKKKEK